MSKAEELAEKFFPKKEHVVFGPLPGASEPSVFDDNEPYRIGFVEGYKQAEKDIRFYLIHKMQECKEKIESGFLNDTEIDIQDLKTEKDNELTWEDMFDIFGLVNVVIDDYADGKTRKEVGEEVLRRFKERR